jgi:hypothetical protein
MKIFEKYTIREEKYGSIPDKSLYVFFTGTQPS